MLSPRGARGVQSAELSGYADSENRPGRCDALGTGQLDEDASAALDGGDGSNDLHRLDLRSSATTCPTGEGSASVNATLHRCSKEEERSGRCRQDCRLLALHRSGGIVILLLVALNIPPSPALGWGYQDRRPSRA